MKIAITGAGIICAAGVTPQEVFDSIRCRRSGVGTMRYLHSLHNNLPVGEVNMSNDELAVKCGLPVGKTYSRTFLMGVYAVRQALDSAGVSIDGTLDNACRVALVNGTTVGGMDVTEKMLFSGNPDTDFLREHDCGACTRAIAGTAWDGFDSYTTVSTACSSAANAIAVGAEMIRNGEADIVVAGGTEALSLFHFNGFRSLMILDEHRSRPFDAARVGLNLGEGAGYIVLEKYYSARRRHAGVLGWLAGWGVACDAYHPTASSPEGAGAVEAMRRALAMAQLEPHNISYINAHGTGTPNNDVSESAALRTVFGAALPPVSSTKPYTGHTTSACGGIEAVISLLAIKEGFMPGNPGIINPDPDCVEPTQGGQSPRIINVMSNSFGFGGNDTSLIFSKREAGHLPVINRGTKLKVGTPAFVRCADELQRLGKYLNPRDTRRMGQLMKASLLTSFEALEQAGLEKPDAIISATVYGCMANSEQILREMIADAGESVSPTLFMQSTHNTIAGNIAIRLKCHGYNMTISNGAESARDAVKLAQRLIRGGEARNVLVGIHDECTPLFRSLIDEKKLDVELPDEVFSQSFVISEE